jgi:hypothetical protein
VDIGGMLGVVSYFDVLKWVFGVYIVLLWMATVIWTYRDIHARHEEALLQVLAVSMALLMPFAGLGVYMMLRPRQTIADRYERSLEENTYATTLKNSLSAHSANVVSTMNSFCAHIVIPPCADAVSVVIMSSI